MILTTNRQKTEKYVKNFQMYNQLHWKTIRTK